MCRESVVGVKEAFLLRVRNLRPDFVVGETDTHGLFSRACLSCGYTGRHTHTPLSYRACVCVSRRSDWRNGVIGELGLR